MYSFLLHDEAMVYVCMCPRFNIVYAEWTKRVRRVGCCHFTGFEEENHPPTRFVIIFLGSDCYLKPRFTALTKSVHSFGLFNDSIAASILFFLFLILRPVAPSFRIHLFYRNHYTALTNWCQTALPCSSHYVPTLCYAHFSIHPPLRPPPKKNLKKFHISWTLWPVYIPARLPR